MSSNLRIPFGLMALAALPLACGGFVPTSRYASATDSPAAWDKLAIGRRVVVSPKGACAITSAASVGDLSAGRGTPLTGTKSQLLTIRDSLIKTGTDPFVALQVTRASGENFWIKLPTGGKACIYEAPKHIDQLIALAGKRLVPVPWKAECSELVAVGTAPTAVLTASEVNAPLLVGDFEFGARSATDFAAGKAGDSVWLTLGEGLIKVREDVLMACFAKPDEAIVRRPQGLEPLLKIAETRCLKSNDAGKDHVECRTSLGVWQGLMTDNILELALVRRTIGPVHFLDGRPVNGGRYARAIVAVTQGEAHDSRGKALYAALDAAVQNAVGRESGGDVRMAPPKSRDVTYRVHVEVSELHIGELLTQELTENTEYKAGEDVLPNPKKPDAIARVATASERSQEEEQSYQRAVALFEEGKRVAIAECNSRADSIEDSTAKQLAKSGCNVAQMAGGLVQPGDSDLQSARSELSEAKSSLAQTPDTITVPIMKPWSYSKRVYGRSTRAVLSLSMQAADATQPTVKQLALAHEWTDYEVQGDPAHNVKGHSANRGPIDNAEALVPFVADKAGKQLAAELQSAISQATIERAVMAFRAAGNPPAEVGFEPVDAMAFDAVGKRLKRVEFRDRAKVAAGGSFALPAGAARLNAGECLLAVAVTSDASTLDITLYTPDRRHADLRGGRAAVIEVCRAELGTAQTVERILLESKSGGEARWALYRTAER